MSGQCRKCGKELGRRDKVALGLCSDCHWKGSHRTQKDAPVSEEEAQETIKMVQTIQASRNSRGSSASGMKVFGWVLFSVGSLFLFFFAIIGFDTNFGNVFNLPGTLVGVVLMVSGAVFVAGANVKEAIKETKSN
jgi:hypothetical protein